MLMEMSANTNVVTVSTMPLVTQGMERVWMGVKRAIEEVIVNNVSVSKPFTDV